jgi:hypothetical protein
MVSIIARQGAQLFVLALAVAAVVAVCLASITLAAVVGGLTIGAVIFDAIANGRRDQPVPDPAAHTLTVDLTRRGQRS